MLKRFSIIILLICSILFGGYPIDPIPEKVEFDKERASLGKALFFDPNLSKDKKVSCNSCHKKEFAGSINKKRGIGVFGRETKYNVPSIYNLRFQHVFGWEKKEYSLKKKIEDVMLDPTIMEADFNEIVRYIKNNSFYKDKFLKLYKKIDKDAVIDALYNYLITLNTPNSKFDRYLLGKESLSNKEKIGYELFKSYGCIACHNGKNVGGHFYFRLGYFLHKKSQKYIKCPSLRNINKTSPYLHDGSIKDLKETVKRMASFQLERIMIDEDAEYIVEFLKTLTGKIDDKKD